MASGRLTTPDVIGGRAGKVVGSQRLLGGTFLVAVAMATVGERGLPSPRRYAAIVLLWFIFGLAAELGGQVARFTGALAALTTLAMTMGTGGRRALGWLTRTAGELQTSPAGEPSEAGAGSTSTPAARAARGRGGPLVGGGSRTRPSSPASGGGGGGVG